MNAARTRRFVVEARIDPAPARPRIESKLRPRRRPPAKVELDFAFACGYLTGHIDASKRYSAQIAELRAELECARALNRG